MSLRPTHPIATEGVRSARVLGLVSLLILITACQLPDEGTARAVTVTTRAGDATESGVGAVPVSTGTCSITEIDREPIVLPDGSSVYVEAHGFHPLGRGFVLVGMPTYESLIAANGAASYVGDRRFLGVVVQPGEEVETIPLLPDVEHLTWIRSVLHEDGTLSVLGPESTGNFYSTSEVLRIVYAEYANGRWSRTETLTPPSGTLHFDTASELVPIGGEVAWAVVNETHPMSPWPVLLYRGRLATMRSEPVLQHSPDRLMLHPGPDGLVLGIAGLDPSYGLRQPTLELLLTESGETVGRFFPADRGRARTPRALTRPDGLTVAWTTQSDLGWSSWVATGVRPGARVRPHYLTDGAPFFAMVPLGARAALVVVDRSDPIAAGSELRFYRVEGDDVTDVGSMPSPYTGPFNALAISDTEILVVGADDEPTAPFPYVRSLVLRLSLTC